VVSIEHDVVGAVSEPDVPNFNFHPGLVSLQRCSDCGELDRRTWYPSMVEAVARQARGAVGLPSMPRVQLDLRALLVRQRLRHPLTNDAKGGPSRGAVDKPRPGPRPTTASSTVPGRLFLLQCPAALWRGAATVMQ
jgi:hypothetical protein